LLQIVLSFFYIACNDAEILYLCALIECRVANIMNYIKATFHLDTEEFIKDIFVNDLAEAGFESFEQTSLGVVGYCSENVFNEKLLRQVIDNLLSKPQIKFRIDKIEDKNWNEIWEQNFFKPIDIENRVFIRSSQEKSMQNFDYEIIINPKQSFGTGGHETTALIISQMLKMNFLQKNVLDFGCGTAVLAILAAKMGAKNVTAVDIDKWAVENSIENITENQVFVETILGNINSVKNRRFDIIFANISRNILLEILPSFSQMLNNKGIVILSGFLEDDIKIMKKNANQYDFHILEEKIKNNWVMLVMKKKY
jgi:ribosomal protein L11 methyltransferase